MITTENLRTEYLVNPIGIDVVVPRFFWTCYGAIRQTAYQIVVTRNEQTVWDSGKVISNKMVGIPYGGVEPRSRERFIWKVRLWDENDEEGTWSKDAFFEMGLLLSNDWNGKWITGNYKSKRKTRYPVDCFFRQFHINKKIVKARLYITACGVYEAKINGERVGSFILAPGFTDYSKRIQYQTYDVTNLIKQESNVLTVDVADGWYRGSLGAMGITGVYGQETKLLLQLEIDFVDGSSEILTSGSEFRWSNDGPIGFADTQDGEHVDARLVPSYKEQAKVTSFSVTPTSSNNVPVEEHECFKPTILKSPSGKTLLDFGQNIAGYLHFQINAVAGQTIRIQMAETLKDGELDMVNIQCKGDTPKATPKQEIKYICKDGVNVYKTKFAIFGFRYAEIESDISFTPENFTSIAVYSSMKQTGYFSCSNPLINRFVENTLWSMKGNFLDVPTDCPTRERAPWTGDVQIFCKTGSYLMDTSAFLRKWLYDVRDRQHPNGKVPCHAPDVRNNEYLLGLDFIKRMDGCCGWADAAVLVPWRLYEVFQDKEILHKFYFMMKKHIMFQISRTNRAGLFGKPVFGPDKKYISNVGQAFGEWLEPPEVYKQSIIKDFIAPHPEEATAYLSYISGIMMQIAELTGHKEDISLYREYYEGCKDAYQNQFVKDGELNTDRQSKLVRPLAFDLLDEPEKGQVTDQLLLSIKRRDYKIGTGFLSTPLILPTLTRLGHLETAYKLMENEQSPGWLAEVKAGATTVWENWDGSASNNHYSPGSVCEWLFETVCGIRVFRENTFYIAPHPGGTLTHAQFTYESIFGTVSCSWKKEFKGITYIFSIPTNCTAEVILPNRVTQSYPSGMHTVVCEIE